MFGPEDIWAIALGGLASLIANILYMAGGTEGFKKWHRRVLGAFVLALAGNLLALHTGKWAWPMLLFFPSLFGGFTLPYGAATPMAKFALRLVFALGVCFAGFFGLWATGFTIAGFGILGMQVGVGVWSIYLGVKNPYINAPLEQFLISNLLTFTIPFWGYVG